MDRSAFDALVQRYNSDLANGLGNLASRTLTMITRYFKGEVPYPSHTAHTAADAAIADAARKAIADYGSLFDQYQFSRALETAWGLVGAVDKYIVENEPWSLGEKQDEESRSRLATVLYTSAEALRIVTALAHPVMPDATAKIWPQLGLGDIRKFDLEAAAGDSCRWARSSGEVQAVFPAGRQIGSREDAENGRTEDVRRWRRSPVASLALCQNLRPRRASRAAAANRQPQSPMAKSASTTSRKWNCAWPR